MCLLARIEYCDEYPHKMAFAEMYRISVDTNIINNNNIATRNLYIRDDDFKNSPHQYPREILWTTIAQPHENTAPITLHFDALNPDYYLDNRVIVTLDNPLWEAWETGGFLGTGFTVLDSQRIEITNIHAEFTNIYSDSTRIGTFGLEFYPTDTNEIAAETSFFTLSQTNDETEAYQGGTIFQITYNTNQDDGSTPYTSSIKPKQKVTGYNIYPNPANTKLTIFISEGQNIKHTFELTDLSGKILLSEICQPNQGHYSKQLDVSNLAVGTYFVRISSNNKTEVRKINILR